jgi:hypothetical protein
MVGIRIGDVSMATLDDDAYASVLQAAAPSGGEPAYPNLFGLADPRVEIEPLELLDELATLASTEHGARVAVLIGTLRDDLMAAVAAAGEG